MPPKRASRKRALSVQTISSEESEESSEENSVESDDQSIASSGSERKPSVRRTPGRAPTRLTRATAEIFAALTPPLQNTSESFKRLPVYDIEFKDLTEKDLVKLLVQTKMKMKANDEIDNFIVSVGEAGLAPFNIFSSRVPKWSRDDIKNQLDKLRNAALAFAKMQ